MILAGVVGILGAIGGSIEVFRDRSLGEPTPQTISAAALLAEGPGTNRHVTVTDFMVGKGTVEVSSISSLETYLVVSPPGTPPGTPGKSLIIHVTEYRAEGDVGNLDHAAYTGIYTPDEHISGEIRKLLGVDYPDLPFDSMPFLEVRPYKGENLTRVLVFVGVGIPLLVAGIIGMVAVNRRMAEPPPKPKKKKRRAD
jgi:hypothetical protein